eukprot:6209810-Pleurochrysis_carterae.AAC.2
MQPAAIRYSVDGIGGLLRGKRAILWERVAADVASDAESEREMADAAAIAEAPDGGVILPKASRGQGQADLQVSKRFRVFRNERCKGASSPPGEM